MVANIFIQTFEDIYTAVCNRVKVPTSLTAELNKVKTFINEEHQKVAAKRDWWWLYLYQRAIQAPQKYDTGTVSPTLGSATVPGTSTAWTGTNNVGTQNLLAQDLIRVTGDDEIYEVKTVTNGTSIVLGTIDANTVYLESSKTTNAYEAYRYLFNLPTNFSEMLSVYIPAVGGRTRHLDPLPVGIKTLRQIQMNGGLGFAFRGSAKSAGTPSYYLISGTETTKQLMIWPPPDSEDMTVYYDYKRRIANLSADADEPLLPLEFRPYLVAAAAARYAKYNLRNSDLFQAAEADRAEIWADMVGDTRQKAYADQPEFRIDMSRYRIRRRLFARDYDPDYAARG